MQITLIINPESSAFARVASNLQSRGIQVVVIDPGLSAALSVLPTSQGFSFRYGDHNIGDSKVIWNYYKTSHAAFGFTPEWVESYVADKQCNAVFASLLLCMADRVVNSLSSMQAAGSKLHQQHIARQLGLNTPDTLVSNNPEEIRAWCFLRGDVIIKALGSPILPVLADHPGLGQDVMPTCRVSQELLEQMGNERCVHPYLIQKEVAKAYEIRALMVHNRLFLCRIDSQQEASMQIDWRRGGKKVVMKPMEHDPQLAAFMQSFLAHYGLFSGVFDFIVTPEGETVFLECNTQGMWGDIDKAFDFAPSQAFAEALVARAGSFEARGRLQPTPPIGGVGGLG